MEQEIYESETQRYREQQKERIRKRYSVKIDPANYRYILDSSSVSERVPAARGKPDKGRLQRSDYHMERVYCGRA